MMAPPSRRALTILFSRSVLLFATRSSSSALTAALPRTSFIPAASSSPAFTRRVLGLESRAPSTLLFLRGGGSIGSSGIGRLGSTIQLSSVNSAQEEEDEPRTGWLHNTEPKYYTPSATSSANAEDSPARKRLLIEKMKNYRNHRIINPPAIYPCGDDQRMMVTEHKIAVPLDYPDLVEAMARQKNNNNEEDVTKKQRIIPVNRIDAAFYDNAVDLTKTPTVDLYFTIIELVSTSEDELFCQQISDLGLTPQQRAEKYLQRSSGSDPSNMSTTCVDPSRTILYLQGGPGFGCATPVSGLSLASSKSTWAAQALLGGIKNADGKSFEKVLLMDQRGTGKSSPISKQKLKKLFPDLFVMDDESGSPEEGNIIGNVDLDSDTHTFRIRQLENESPAMQLKRAKASKALSEATDYLSKFRADSIVRDVEWIREALIRPVSISDPAVVLGPSPPKPWGAALGQSFGGFCIMTYLSSIMHPPKICLFTGGIAPMDTPVREVYDRLWLRVRERNWRYYEQYPGDVERVKKIVRFLEMKPVALPSGGILTARRFLQLGLGLGGSPGSSFANLHDIIGSAFLDDEEDSGNAELSNSFLKTIDIQQSYDDAPLYYLLHESIYADGPKCGAMNWAASTSHESYMQSNPEFDYRVTSLDDSKDPVLFSGEMVFPYMAQDDFAEVSGHGMRMLSEALAKKEDWLPLFDATNMRTALLGGKTKGAAAVYYEDMYVDFDCCMKLVQRGMPLEGVKVWVTNEYQHSGVRDDGANIFKKIMAMAKGSVHVPS